MYLRIEGKFWCQRCDHMVVVARYYFDLDEIQWLCKCNHVSRVSLSLNPGPTIPALVPA